MPNVATILAPVKPLRVVKPNPKDPDWKFPYASRERIEMLRIKFARYALKIRGWTKKPQQSFLNKLPKKQRAGLGPWPTVLPEFREQTDTWFKRKLAEAKAKYGEVSTGKYNSLKGNAVYFGMYVLTGKRRGNKWVYNQDKKIWLAYLDWEAKQQYRAQEVLKPHTASKLLEL